MRIGLVVGAIGLLLIGAVIGYGTAGAFGAREVGEQVNGSREGEIVERLISLEQLLRASEKSGVSERADIGSVQVPESEVDGESLTGIASRIERIEATLLDLKKKEEQSPESLVERLVRNPNSNVSVLEGLREGVSTNPKLLECLKGM